MKWVFELPHFQYGAGGIRVVIELAREVQRQGHDVQLRFQRRHPQIENGVTDFGLPTTTGRDYSDFPSCDTAVTYSDTDNIEGFMAAPQIGKKAIFMLSFGMAPNIETKNVMTPGLTIFTSSYRTQREITNHGIHSTNVGHGHDWHEFFPEPGVKKTNTAAVLFHTAKDKRYEMAMNVAALLCKNKMLAGINAFGMFSIGSGPYLKAEKWVDATGCSFSFYPNADRATIRNIFSASKLFIMPSVTEGYNLTPAEATLCGCPTILCDGAIGELYFTNVNCRIVNRDRIHEMYGAAKEIMEGGPDLAEKWRGKMAVMTNGLTWERTAKLIIEAMSGTA